MITLSYTFTFEAAHYLPSAPEGNPNRRLHGHSFAVKVSLQGEQTDPQTGLLLHFDDIRSALEPLRDSLDHRLLNDIAGLEQPTLERIAQHVFAQAAQVLPGVFQVTVTRPTCGEECVYTAGG